MKIKAKIVVINCEATNPEGLQDKLEREGMEVEVVSDRKAALNRIAKQKPDLILLDNTLCFDLSSFPPGTNLESITRSFSSNSLEVSMSIDSNC